MDIKIAINEPSVKFKDASIAPMHTAEHILNGTMNKLFNCGRAFSSHVERKKSKLDYHLKKALTEEQIQNLEMRVNQVIDEDLKIWTEFVKKADMSKRFDLFAPS